MLINDNGIISDPNAAETRYRCHSNAGPWSTTAWSSKGSRSLQADIQMSDGSQHDLSKSGNTDFSGYSKSGKHTPRYC
ncbi:hypothetical protein [Paludifilum halophilum]|uniref:hypothetical protein n=1 Tax=Paludifilum halophilum TaxID=1642702 RepID=UPI0030840AD8